MRKKLKYLGSFLTVIATIILGFYLCNNESLPIGESGQRADLLAHKMLKAIGHDAYKNTNVLEWTFREKNNYKWFKQQNIVEVSWDNIKVILNTKDTSKSEVFINNKKEKNLELITKAKDNFNNDSFWLIAPHKVFDNGVTRSIVNYEGKDALLVTYNSGGSTPGDSYLWILDEKGMPTDYKMWTKIIPIGGTAASWNNWKETETGLKLPTEHSLSLIGLISLKIDMGNVKAYN